MEITYYQAISQASQNTKVEIFENVYSYLVESPNFADLTIKQIEEWNSKAPYNLLHWTSKRWIRETKSAYVERITQNVTEQIRYILNKAE